MVQNVTTRILAGVSTHSREAYVTSGEQEQLVDAVIDSLATLFPSQRSLSHPPVDPGAEFFSKGLQGYRDAYERGYLDRTLVEALTQRFSLNRMAPEDPVCKSIQSTHARDLRQWTFSTLFASWGMDWARDTLEEPLAEVDEEGEGEEGQARAIPILQVPDRTRSTGTRRAIPTSSSSSRPRRPRLAVRRTTMTTRTTRRMR